MKKKLLLTASVVLVSIILIFAGNKVKNEILGSGSTNLTQSSSHKTAINKTSKDKASSNEKVVTNDKDTSSSAVQSQSSPKDASTKVQKPEVRTSPSSTGSSVASTNATSNSSSSSSIPKNSLSKEEPNFTITDALTGKTIISTYIDVEGKTVGDVTLEVLKNNNIPRETSGSGYSLYFCSIAGIREKENGKNSGWIYFVDGNSPEVGCGAYKLKAGDKIVWKYSTN